MKSFGSEACFQTRRPISNNEFVLLPSRSESLQNNECLYSEIKEANIRTEKAVEYKYLKRKTKNTHIAR
jgi:hypothetical protein